MTQTVDKDSKEINILNCAQRNHSDERCLSLITEHGKQVKLKFCSAADKQQWVDAFKNVSKLVSESHS